SSIRESSSDSEASESSIEIQTSPAPRGLITKEPFKGPAEVEVTTPYNQMDLDQDIQVINPKDKNVSRKERHKWRMPELPLVPKSRVGTSPKYLDRHHELISSSEEINGARKDRRTSEELVTHVLQRTGPTDKTLVEKTKHVIRGPEEEVGPRKGKQPSGSSPSLHKQKSASTSAKKAQENPKDQPEGQEKGKGKGKAQVEQALPAELQDSQEREEIHGQCVQYGKSSDGIQKPGRGKIEPIFSKEVDLVKLVNQIETCHKEIITNFKTFKIESKVTLLNQPDDNSISFITRQSKELRIQVQNLENSTGHNAALFQEKLEESGKSRLELKEDIRSSINNISLKNAFPRQSTSIFDRNVLNLNNHLHHTSPSNA
ncbi:hypothetical protein O181_121515, partial [Austropuccinia psidii MF-1]|nr:hypothetical protein [Austropuccinia psidii MF-1]